MNTGQKVALWAAIFMLFGCMGILSLGQAVSAYFIDVRISELSEEMTAPTEMADLDSTAVPTVPTVESTVPPAAESGEAVSLVYQEGGFVVMGAPASVTMPQGAARLVTPAEMANRIALFGPSANLNSLGLNTQICVGDAGTYLTYDQNDAESNDSAWLITPDTQYILSSQAPAYANLVEGGSLWVTAYEDTVRVAQYTIGVQGREGHDWFVILCNKDWDHLIDTDLNLSVEISNYNPGFVQVDRFPPGAFLSQQHLLENVASAHVQKNCGSDGCSSVSVLVLDLKTGGWTVINQPAPGAEWHQVATNVQ